MNIYQESVIQAMLAEQAKRLDLLQARNEGTATGKPRNLGGKEGSGKLQGAVVHNKRTRATRIKESEALAEKWQPRGLHTRAQPSTSAAVEANKLYPNNPQPRVAVRNRGKRTL
jgi:hypothetical protein